MDRVSKLALIQRSLGIRHKLKVHESINSPGNHEELSVMLLTKWELEDELRALAKQRRVLDDRGNLLKSQEATLVRLEASAR